jgi:hypothetical protein
MTNVTQLISYHKKTQDLALFSSDGQYWIGSYMPTLTHQNSEPPYILIRGFYSSREEGELVLASLKGDEF